MPMARSRMHNEILILVSKRLLVLFMGEISRKKLGLLGLSEIADFLSIWVEETAWSQSRTVGEANCHRLFAFQSVGCGKRL